MRRRLMSWKWNVKEERKDAYIKVPEKLEYDTPTGKTAGSRAVEEYFHEDSPVINEGRLAASTKHDYEHYKKYGSYGPDTPLKGRSVDLDYLTQLKIVLL